MDLMFYISNFLGLYLDNNNNYNVENKKFTNDEIKTLLLKVNYILLKF